MKKKLLLAGIVCLMLSEVKAQINPDNPITTSVKVGGNVSNVFNQDLQDFKLGYQVSGGIELPLTYKKRVSLQLELLYSSLGFIGKEYKQYNAAREYTGVLKLEDVTLHYLSVPLTFKIYATPNLSFDLGGQIGRLVGADAKNYDFHKANTVREYLNLAQNNLDKYLFENGYRSTKVEDYYESIDYGVHLGATYNFENGIFLNGRLYYGLQDIYKKDNSFSKLATPVKETGMTDAQYQELLAAVNFFNSQINFNPLNNVSFQLSVGYRF